MDTQSRSLMATFLFVLGTLADIQLHKSGMLGTCGGLFMQLLFNLYEFNAIFTVSSSFMVITAGDTCFQVPSDFSTCPFPSNFCISVNSVSRVPVPVYLFVRAVAFPASMMSGLSYLKLFDHLDKIHNLYNAAAASFRVFIGYPS